MTYSVVMVYEGDTEGVFYPLAIQEIRKELGLSTLPFKIHHVNIRGIGNFQTKLLAKMKNDIIPKCNSRIIVVLCYDTDVFEFYPHPFVNWQKLENELYKLGINQVIHMRARHSIEDFFFLKTLKDCVLT